MARLDSMETIMLAGSLFLPFYRAIVIEGYVFICLFHDVNMSYSAVNSLCLLNYIPDSMKRPEKISPGALARLNGMATIDY